MNNMKILFISLGCDKNLVDSEHMLGLLVEHGFEITDSEEDAEVIVINTCCFIHDAKEESIQNILEMAKYRTAGSCKVLLVTGCMAERYRDEIIEEIPEVDAVLGTNSYDKILDAIQDVLGGDRFQEYADLKGLPKIDAQRVVTTGGHYEYLKIAEGCDKHCTYCVIPSIRGNYRSVPMEDILAEAASLAADGVKELILVAQETTLYGVDLYGKKTLPTLLKKLSEIEGIRWIRLQYCYPEEITDELIRMMADNPKVCHYIDIPIQHANDEVLKRMGRKTSQADLRRIVGALRQAMPDICIRTTLICGFPGETEQAHEELKTFVSDMKFDRLGCFAYSRQEGTPADTFPDQVPEEIKQVRVAEIMELQQDISAACNETYIGMTLDAFVEGKVADENVYVARTYRDAPDVDGYVFIQTTRELMTGDIVSVHVTGSYEYDLIGELA